MVAQKVYIAVAHTLEITHHRQRIFGVVESLVVQISFEENLLAVEHEFAALRVKLAESETVILDINDFSLLLEDGFEQIEFVSSILSS